MRQSIKFSLFSFSISFAIIGIAFIIANGRPFSSTLGAPVVLISEEDGDPISRLRLLQVPNDSLTDAGGGILSLDTSSGDANAVDVAASTNSLAVAISTTGVVVLKNAVDISTVNAAKVDRDGDTLTGQLILVDGTAATPSIRGTADNSGLSFSSVKMVWSRLGADKIRFDGAGISMPSGLAINLGGIDTASDNISKIGADIRIRAGGTDVAFFGSALIRLNKPVDVLGTITATGLDCTDCVNTSDIADSAVTSGKIGDGAVTSDKVSAGAIQTAKLANGAVTEIKIADGSITTAKFADICAADQVIARNAGDTAWECATVGGVALGDSPTWTGSHTWDNPLLAPSGSPGAPSYSFTSDTNSGMQNSAADELAFVTAGGQRVIIRSAEILVFQPLRTELGSAGIPSHSFRQDTNTGMFRTTEGDTLGFSTNSSERMRINASGNVGIGDSSPTTAKLTVQVSEASQEGLRISSQNASVMFVVDRLGNVGIGVVPASALNIPGGSGVLADGLTFGDGDTGFFESADGTVLFASEGSSRIKFSGDGLTGNTANSGFMVNEAVSATNPSIGPNKSDFDTGIGATTSGNILHLITGGVTALTVDASQNVGINETAPNARLEVKAALADLFTLQISSQDGSAVMVIDRLGRVGVGLDTPLDTFHVRQSANRNLWIRSGETLMGGRTGIALDSFTNAVALAGLGLRGDEVFIHTDIGLAMVLDTMGRVGIKEATPNARLEVKADITDLFIVQVSSQNGTAIMQIDRLGHTIATGADPVITSCGTTPSVSGSDRAGNVTIGTEVTTSCTVTFAEPYASTPSCTVTGDNTAVTYARTISATVLTIISSADMASDVISYNCVGL